MTRQTSESTQQVQLPSRVVERIERRIPRTEFDDTSEYITHVLEEVLIRVEDHTAEEIDEDREELEARLKSLGYLED